MVPLDDRLQLLLKPLTSFQYITMTTSNALIIEYYIHHTLLLALLTLLCTWPTVPKACAMPTNRNAHVLVQRLLRCTCEAYTTNMYTLV